VARRSTLLEAIESEALDPTSDLPCLLRKCIALGGRTGSERIRDWASRELKGYGNDEIPSYRSISAPLMLDGANARGMFRGTFASSSVIPAEAHHLLTDTVEMPQPIAEIVELHDKARSDGESSIRLAFVQ
jgi:hypothetical protein